MELTMNPGTRWTGRALSLVAVLFLIFDGVIKILVIPPVVDAFANLGIPAHLPVFIGALELGLVALYLVPATSVFGAILLTGFLGGATMLHLRHQDTLFGHILFPVYVGLFLWGGLFLRLPQLRAVFPLRRAA